MHELRLRPRFAELDPYDHVNHAVYVSWFEEGRVRALEEIGMGLDRLKADGVQIVVTEVQLRYRSAVTASDEAVVQSRITKIRRASAKWAQRVVVGDRVAVECELLGGLTDATGRPTRPTAGFMDRFRPLLTEEWS